MNMSAVNVTSDVKVPLVLCFRVKFYPSDPAQLKEEITRYCNVGYSILLFSCILLSVDHNQQFVQF